MRSVRPSRRAHSPRELDGSLSTPRLQVQIRAPPFRKRIGRVTGMDWNFGCEWSPLHEDVLLKGQLQVVVRDSGTGRPRSGQRVVVRGCGFV